MKAIVFDGQLRFSRNHPVPEPGDGEALVKVCLAGICNTDLEIIKGYMGFQGVIGHEFVGVVEKTWENQHLFIGKRVVGDINCGCGACLYCKAGLQRHCPSRTTLGIAGKNGAMAEYITLPVHNLFLVPENVKNEEAVFVEPLAAAYEILEQIHLRPTDRVLVLGDGKLGLLVALVLDLCGPEVALAGKHEDKLAIARGQGVCTVALESLTGDKAFDIVVDATGSPKGLEAALRFVKPRGTIVLKTTVAEGITMNLAPVVVNEVKIIGSRCGPFGPALMCLAQKRIKVGPLISGVYGFSHAGEAFTKAQDKRSLKVLIDFSK